MNNYEEIDSITKILEELEKALEGNSFSIRQLDLNRQFRDIKNELDSIASSFMEENT